jgi:DtxR family Mn-dependent transcriptional regulator
MPKTRKAIGSAKASQESGDIDGQVDLANERLSPGTENYLLCLYRLWEDSETPTITQLTDTLKQLPPTEGLGTSVPSVSGMIRRMQRQNLVEVGSDKRIRLTTTGLECGVDIARRHRLAEWLVVELLGMELRHAHIEAHRLEHGISPELEEKLVERLRHPKRSPFGRPIPLAGQPEKPLNSKTLDSVPLDTIFAVDRVPEEDMELLRFLSDAGIVPDQNIEVVEAAPYRGVIIVKSSKDRVSIGYNVATQIVIRPIELT